MQKAFRARLLSDPVLSGLLADLYPEVAPVGAGSPAAVYTVTQGEPIACQVGTIYRDSVEVTVWSEDKDEAVEVGRLIAARLNRWSGTLAGETIDGVSLSGAPEDGYDEVNHEYARILRFWITYQL